MKPHFFGSIRLTLSLACGLAVFAVGCSKSGLVDATSNTSNNAPYSLRALHNTDSLQSVCTVQVPEPEPANLAALAGVTMAQAESIALATFPGTRVLASELENENGCLVYGFALDDGTDAKIDAGDGTFLYADTGADGESESAGEDSTN